MKTSFYYRHSEIRFTNFTDMRDVKKGDTNDDGPAFSVLDVGRDFDSVIKYSIFCSRILIFLFLNLFTFNFQDFSKPIKHTSGHNFINIGTFILS